MTRSSSRPRRPGFSPEQVERRRAAVPEVRYPPELPIAARQDELLAAIRDHQVVVVAGETGSGKSTQLPKMCLDLGRGVEAMIGHTQPRRLAARTVAERVAEELGTEVGGAVGYAVRFTDRVGEGTLVKVMTDGILLAELQRDRLLRRYDTIIVDEAHERSLNVDFILGYLKQLLPRRPDLKVVVTSATIDTERFSEHFGGAPVIEVSGRAHPVEVRYRPVGEAEDDRRDQVQAVCDAVMELGAEGPGDVLVFLSGEREIRDTADALAELELPGTEVLPLYARLSVADQHRVFAAHPGRRVVLATNVAETSITVPGVRYVVDAGTARISRYNRRTKVQRLPIEPVSRASADQRAGRCGRVAPGICVRLYSEEDYAARPEFTDPEVLRTNLASVVLQMTALGLGDVAAFPFVDPPDNRAIKDGVALLEELGALSPDATTAPRRLTSLGRRLAQLPLDPRLGRMVLEAEGLGCLREVMVIAAALSIQDPRERPLEKRQAADELHRRFADPTSDFLAYLNLWDHLREQQKALSSNQFRKLCRAEFLNYLRVREWQDIYSQLRQATAGLGARTSQEAGREGPVHLALLTGLLSHIGVRDGDSREYRGARDARFALSPASSLARKPPRWVMAAELVETDRLWARVAARIQPEWAERAAPHLVKYEYGDPWWDSSRGTAVAEERVTLFGLPLAARRADYGRVDPEAARELFVRHALVEGDWSAPHPFVARNQRLVEQVRALEERARRRDILVDDEVLAEFFDQRVGAAVTSARQFDGWWKKERASRPDRLDFTPELLISPSAAGVSAAAFPDEWAQGDLRLRLSYRFLPGEEDDGVTVHVPLVLLDRLRDEGFDWHLPGLRPELVAGLIRSLPKPLRRDLVPVAEHAAAFLRRAEPAHGPLLAVLGRALGLPPASWDLDRLPGHLRLRFRVEDEDGRTVAVGRDLGALQARLHEQVRAAVARAGGAVEREGLVAWDFGTLPRRVELFQAGHRSVGYPALVDEGTSVAVRTLASEDEQWRAMWGGVRRLLLLTLPSPVPLLHRRLENRARLALASGPDPSVEAVLQECADCALDDLLVSHGGPVWDGDRFAKLAEAVRGDWAEAAGRTVAVVVAVLAGRRSVEDRLGTLKAPALQPTVVDVRAQLDRLVHPGFVTTAGTARLEEVPRYLTAIERRLDKLAGNLARDQERMRSVQRLEEDYRRVLERVPARRRGHELLQVRWMIEELRVSYFAQALGTPVPVSETRILRALVAADSM